MITVQVVFTYFGNIMLAGLAAGVCALIAILSSRIAELGSCASPPGATRESPKVRK
jgi:hypothetical protein